MAATLQNPNAPRVVPFKRECGPVTRTDTRRRLPAISSAELEGIFDHAGHFENHLKKAA